MDKIIVMVRTSTDIQSIEDQHNEMEAFVLSKGWKKEQIIWIEEQGASAAKVDSSYRAMIDEVKKRVEEDSSIKCFAVWHLNRLARTEEVWVEVKSFFVSHKVQVLVKNPELKLLTSEGKIDPGMELAMGLLAILSKQDQEERKEKFARAKKSMAKKGQYMGGNTVPFGYSVNGVEFVEDEEKSALVKLIFDLYSTGKYSGQTLAAELQERGYKVTERQVVRIFRNKAYTGEPVGEIGIHYPPIISKELFDKCAEIRSKNKLDMRRNAGVILGKKLVRCYKCGASCTSNSKYYACCRASKKCGCDNNIKLRQDVADNLLWRTAYGLHIDYLMNRSENQMEEYRKNLEVLEEKIREGERKMEEFAAKKERIVESYMDGLIDRKTRDFRLLKTKKDELHQQDSISALNDRKRALVGLLEGDKRDTTENFLSSLETIESEEIFDIIHKHISKLTAIPISYGKRDPRSKKNNALKIEVTSNYGTVYKFMYFPRYYKGHNLYVFNGKEWVGDRVTPISHTSK